MAIKRIGYGQVEPNHLSGIVTGQIYAQLPAKDGIKQLEQGQFAKYDYAKGVVDTANTAEGEYMLVYNEEKLYDERRQNHKDFVYKTSDFTDGKIYPRLIKTNIGDIITTNMIGKANTSEDAEAVLDETDTNLDVGKYLEIDENTGILKSTTAKPEDKKMAWIIVKKYTMPDGQPGFKIQRVQ